MKTRLQFFFIFTLIAINSQIIVAQEITDIIQTNLNCYNSTLRPEKIYVQTDKTLYAPGEKIWFKTYLTSAVSHKLLLSPEKVTVELINPSGKVEQKFKLLTNQGVAHNFFTLSAEIKGGLYKLKAYTIWSQNQIDSMIFEKELTIQKVLTTNILMKLDFEKEAYGAGQTVTAKLSLKNLENEPMRFQPIRAKWLIENKLLSEQNLTTDFEGKAEISFTLPDALKFPDGVLNILTDFRNQTEAISRSIPIVLNNIDLKFYPEGGYLLAGTENVVAFEALNEFGKPADVEGLILDENNMEIARFSSFKFGMGSFRFVPEAGKSYYAQILKPQKSDTRYEIPAALDEGYVLSFEKEDAKSLNFNILSSAGGTAFLTASVRDSVRYAATLILKSGNNKIEIPISELSDGIVRVSLFNSVGKPECERLVYHGKQNPMHIEINELKSKYSEGETAEFEILTSIDGMPIPAELSLAVVDDKNLSYADDKQDNMLSWMLLSSDVKGKLFEPSFYFNPEEENTREAIDFVLLTHGWRRYTWKSVLTGMPASAFKTDQTPRFYGRVVSRSSGKAVKATVRYFELTSGSRAAELETNADGYFVFTHINPSSAAQIVAHSRNPFHRNLQILQFQAEMFPAEKLTELFGTPPISQFQALDFAFNSEKTDTRLANYSEQALDVPELNISPKTETILPKNNTESQPKTDETNGTDFGNAANDMPFSGEEQIQEITVSALGISKDSKAMGYSVTRVDAETVNSLKGKVAGVMISNTSGNVGASSTITMRGFSSISDNNLPLYVIDGVPVENLSGNSLDFIDLLNPADIQSVSLMNSSLSTAVFGSSAANGVILIETNGNIYNHSSIFYIKNKYTSSYIASPNINDVNANTTDYYSTSDFWKTEIERNSRISTVFWNPHISTDAEGKARISLYCPKEVSSYKITFEGIARSGEVGRAEANLNVVKPLYLQTKIPNELSFNDTIRVAVVLVNSTDKPISGILRAKHGDKLLDLADSTFPVTIAPDSSTKVLIPMRAKNIVGSERIELFFDHDKYSQKQSYDLKITPRGFPKSVALSGDNPKASFSFEKADVLPGSMSGSFKIYVSTLKTLTDGVAGMLRQPSGCFEQTSSSTYPNILALQLLRESGNTDHALEQKAYDFIDAGYKRLISFETPEHGFEWFGHTPPHEGLTAMGILEFTDMKTVYNKVDDKMLDRTKTWLLSRRDGNGNFTIQQHALHSWGNAQNTANAYIVFALAKSGISDIEKEYEKAKNEAFTSKDPYRLGLLANAAFYLKKSEDCALLTNVITEKLKTAKPENLKIEPSITQSSGNALQTETMSLYLSALLKQQDKNIPEISNAASFVNSGRRNGSFYSTQATVLALTALTEYARYFKTTQKDIHLKIKINETEIDTLIKLADADKFQLRNLENYLSNQNKQSIEIEVEGEGKIPYAFDFSWNTLSTETDSKCPINLQTKLHDCQTHVGEIARLTVEISNKTDKAVPMSIAEIGIPAGLSLQPQQLKELSEKQLWDFYELFDGKLVLYFTSLDDNENRTVNLDLKAETAGRYTSQVSSAYLYYTNEHKTMQGGTQIEIAEK